MLGRSLVLALLLFASIASAAISRPQTIVVVDPQGQPLPGVTLRYVDVAGQPQSVITTADGRAVITTGDDATLVAELSGFATTTQRVVPGDEPLRIVMQLEQFTAEETVVGIQSRVPLSEMSSSVTVIDRVELDRLMSTSANLADALGKAVPGLAPGNGTVSIYGQTMRGRAVQVLVDGVSLTTLRNGARDLSAIDPSSIERIEVLRGTTALYGDGATGGLVNIITSQPRGGAMQMRTDFSIVASPSSTEESAGARLAQSVSGSAGRLDYRLEIAADRSGAMFDAEGDRIPADPYGQGGLADTNALSFAGTAGWALPRGARLAFTTNIFSAEQETEWTTDPSVNSQPAQSVKSRAIKGLSLDHPQGSDNELFQLTFEDRSIFGSAVRAQLYRRDYQTIFTPFDGRAFAIYGRQIFQSRIESESFGLRTDVQTPLPIRGLTAYWGFDAASEETQQPVWIMDPIPYDASGGRVFRTVGNRPWVPLIDKQTRAAFAQLEWMLNERWLVRGGLRHDRVAADIPTFTTLTNVAIEGGNRTYSDTLMNAGIVRYFGRDSRVWLSYGEGFSLPDIGLVLRSAPAGASLDTLPFTPQVVEAWELGYNVGLGPVEWSTVTFYSTSELGTSTAGFAQPVLRAPERVHGIEAALEYRPKGRWATGLTGSYTEGKHDPNRDGVFTYLNNYRIAAPNATFWLEHQTTKSWRNRAQILWSGDRDRFANSRAFGELPIESYAVLDLLSTFAVGNGELSVAVQNATNEEYFVRDAQLLRSGKNDSYSAAPGATVRIGWSYRY